MTRTTLPVLDRVMRRAGGRCECTRRGCHGRAERCERTSPDHHLIAAPADVTVPAHGAWRTPVEGLTAWCPRCHDLAATAGRRERAAALAATETGDALPLDLFPALLDGETP